MKRPPIRFVCKSTFTPEERREFNLEPDEGYECTGQCTRPVRAAKFRHPRWDETVILHPSTKAQGKWQLSWFWQGEPWGDTEIDSCDGGLKEMMDRWPGTRIVDGRVVPTPILEEWG